MTDPKNEQQQEQQQQPKVFVISKFKRFLLSGIIILLFIFGLGKL